MSLSNMIIIKNIGPVITKSYRFMNKILKNKNLLRKSNVQHYDFRDHMRNIHRNTLTRPEIIKMSPVLRNLIM